MTDTTATELVERAIEIINERGWCQHTEVDEDGRVCLDEALGLAMSTYPKAIVDAMVDAWDLQAAGHDADWNDEGTS